ncbi:MAG: riboflavin synthase [Flavobacteriaceae bacterium]|jgi:riboflavin synthase|nr:riboflavin synthase [Flavobacteriaceae bacterium]|tara:strand:+ start:31598 stop:32194 length:597 start_codon:yes stop_codon:yes gene_type:complete
MFTGIIQSVSLDSTFKQKKFGVELILKVEPSFTKDLKIGDSVAVNGVCLTVTRFDKNQINFDVIHESLKTTNLNKNYRKLNLNLERSLKMGDEIGGHLVSGHVHEIAEVKSFKEGKERILTINKTPKVKDYIFQKGYVAINGISLTVSDSNENDFSVSLIPETIKATNLSLIDKGDFLNIEADQQTIAIVETVKKIKI